MVAGRTDEVGRYPGRSTIFSGSAYPTMRSWVRVVDVPEYLDHVEGLQEDLAAAQGVVAEEEGEQPTADASEEGSP